MKKDRIVRLHKSFEDCAHHEDGVEFWLARELQELLGYAKWENFEQVIARAKIACTNSGYDVQDHFPDVGKMIGLGTFAMTYFAVQTRKQEIIEQRATVDNF